MVPQFSDYRASVAALVLAGLFAGGSGCQTLTTGQELAKAQEENKKKDEEIAALDQKLDQQKGMIEEASKKANREKERNQAAGKILAGDPAQSLEIIKAIRQPEIIKVKVMEKVKVKDPDTGKEVEKEQVVKDKDPVTRKETDKLEDKAVPPSIDAPEDAQLLAVTGEALVALGRDDEALDAFKGAVEKDPSVRSARRGLGRILFQKKQYPEALEALKPELADGWRDGELLFMIGQARYELGIARKDPDDLEAARLALEAVRLERPSDPDLRRWLVQIEYLAGRHAEAIRLLEDMRREYPLDPEYLEMLGRSYLGLNDRKRALDFLQLASRLKMPDLDGARLLGELYEKEGAKGRAADWLKKAAKNDPREASPEERCRIGLLLAGAQRSEEAVEWLSTLGERDAPYAEAQAALARLYQELGKPELAIAACETARKIRPQDGAVLLTAGRLYLEKKQFPQSTDAFSRASAIPGLEAEGLAGLAEVAYAAGDLEGALRSYQKALQARPGEEKLMVAIRELRAELKLRRDGGAPAGVSREGEKG